MITLNRCAQKDKFMILIMLKYDKFVVDSIYLIKNGLARVLLVILLNGYPGNNMDHC